MQKRTKALQFDDKTKRRMLERDNGCIFCQMGYHMPPGQEFGLHILDPMHIVNKSQGGLGIEQNGVTGCRYHHSLLDNGNQGLRHEMLDIIEHYMKQHYEGWTREVLKYHKADT